MQLTSYTDYSLRLLLYLALQPKDKLSSVKQVATIYNISYNHLTKVTYELGKLGLIETIKGRNGGIRLAKAPEEINIGAVVKQTEDNLELVECFNHETNTCILNPVCRLKGVLHEALTAYLRVLEQYTLKDLLTNEDELQALLKLKP
ncbi:nitric oxide-sensing transcriptional repressor NsrR [Halalkalibacterium halodurans]|jgi:Rrf2 family nitric oxide-sensitive transcriptional repressor|uniref:HTH-type transcriptional regulator NsrR n=2 Tax=Halalkalibacterium halodurans TaxID=86665 RepID=NSRR_HALH5|nr:nitric oxide-sensing transcriptional repressor NsrR [Halalkalibacterium halodurans]Q9RC41.1 RecName: Full=HTH-type transcriptional regulator NsrR [Halalkalibacterium halodurans C-125]MDY7221590.1 nitric oxide-sensing transcriptional repressor NsrR [Halalkalibacterium halodurans]MDY7240866.1 nitric oxide-sensing transcriptional repressor NsrR [Halalkalibacterium halodurans]MED3647831.1 nitric oxide-sensing transcriptional repressor NsrR [Halalkalibacterium halodurans]MED4079260.1 nitric oxid